MKKKTTLKIWLGFENPPTCIYYKTFETRKEAKKYIDRMNSAYFRNKAINPYYFSEIMP
jgi:hypothetical protein